MNNHENVGQYDLIDKIKNDLSSQLRKRTCFEILANFIGEISQLSVGKRLLMKMRITKIMKATYKRLSSTYYHAARDTINHMGLVVVYK